VKKEEKLMTGIGKDREGKEWINVKNWRMKRRIYLDFKVM
jgi:hypothetical protein